MREELESKIREFCVLKGLPFTPHGLYFNFLSDSDWHIVFKGVKFVRLPCEDIVGFLNEIISGEAISVEETAKKQAEKYNKDVEIEKATEKLEKKEEVEIKDEVLLEEPKKKVGRGKKTK